MGKQVNAQFLKTVNTPSHLDDMCHVSSNHRCCAERRLLDKVVREAMRHGVSRHSIVTWVRRKYGADVIVWRMLGNGSLGCSVPCVFCRREIVRFDLRVHVVIDNSLTWYHGFMTDNDAPPSKLTCGQKRNMHKSQQLNA